jgi:Zn-dependent M16 (insulinase) family peptidase
LQQPFDEPRRAVAPYEVTEGQENPKAYVAVNWLLPETGDPELVFGLSILEQVLIGTPAAQLRKALIDSGLGEDLTGRGLETSSRQMFFSTGLKGVDPQNVEKVEKLIQDTAANMAINGVDPDNIAAAINTLEFSLRENNTGSFPRGLVVMLRALDFWLYDKDPLAPLAFEAPLNAIKERLASGEPYFEHLIEAYLINNTHRTTVIMTPDVTLAEKRASAERQRLDQAREKMDQQEMEQVVETTRRLKEMQETPDSPEALMTIPTLDLEDIDREIRRIPIETLQNGQTQVLFHDLFTNGILYLDLGFNLHMLPQEWIPYIPLFSRALTETGTKTESFVQLLQRIGRNTGGIRPGVLASAVRNTGKSIAWLFLRGKAMAGQTGELLAILRDVLTEANLEDRDRIRQMALEARARMESRVMSAGSGIVNTRLSAHFDEADWASEQMGGVSYLFFLRQLTQQIEQDWPSVQKTFQSIRDTLLNNSNAICNVTIDAANWQNLRPQIDDFLSGLPNRPVTEQTWTLPTLPASEGLTIPSQVNYVGKGANLYKLGYQLKGSTFVVNKHVNDNWMWNKVRVQGGAYGGFSAFDSQSGILSFLSYRDPNLLQTLEVYDQTADYLKNLEIDEAELTKVIIGTIGDLDAYMLPDAKGYTSMRWHLLGTTDEERQRLRDEVLSTSPEDFHHFGEFVEKINHLGAVVVLGVDEAVQTAGIFQEVKKVI